MSLSGGEEIGVLLQNIKRKLFTRENDYRRDDEGENGQCIQLLSPQNDYFWFLDNKCSTDDDCKNTCVIGYLCSCNKGTCEINKKEKTLRVSAGHIPWYANGFTGNIFDQKGVVGLGGLINDKSECGGPKRCRSASNQCCWVLITTASVVCPASC